MYICVYVCVYVCVYICVCVCVCVCVCICVYICMSVCLYVCINAPYTPGLAFVSCKFYQFNNPIRFADFPCGCVRVSIVLCGTTTGSRYTRG